ncbi:hypothetical protein [Mycobacterium sp. 1274756.6]|uniref:hypothetical protein n=1 Tax=Mycobacterium sp. 1274756.6 TaxID=1834076 RepID=UPI000800FE4B|nr:hypothetical protein [Mycobacterium sp. 1274756.6]OBJ70135.1 hypothetical protein A5643_10860 [Mycobacterium sp. 1274756.6]
MLSILRSVLRFELRLVEWGLLAGLIAAPYLAAGLVWAVADSDRFAGLGGPEAVLSVLAGIATWPVQLAFAGGCGP